MQGEGGTHVNLDGEREQCKARAAEGVRDPEQPEWVVGHVLEHDAIRSVECSACTRSHHAEDRNEWLHPSLSCHGGASRLYIAFVCATCDLCGTRVWHSCVAFVHGCGRHSQEQQRSGTGAGAGA